MNDIVVASPCSPRVWISVSTTMMIMTRYFACMKSTAELDKAYAYPTTMHHDPYSPLCLVINIHEPKCSLVIRCGRVRCLELSLITCGLA